MVAITSSPSLANLVIIFNVRGILMGLIQRHAQFTEYRRMAATLNERSVLSQ